MFNLSERLACLHKPSLGVVSDDGIRACMLLPDCVYILYRGTLAPFDIFPRAEDILGSARLPDDLRAIAIQLTVVQNVIIEALLQTYPQIRQGSPHTTYWPKVKKRRTRPLKPRRPRISLEQPRQWKRPLAYGVLPAFDEALAFIKSDSEALKLEMQDVQASLKAAKQAPEPDPAAVRRMEEKLAYLDLTAHESLECLAARNPDPERYKGCLSFPVLAATALARLAQNIGTV